MPQRENWIDSYFEKPETLRCGNSGKIACVPAREGESELNSKLSTPGGSFMVSKEVNVCPAICSHM